MDVFLKVSLFEVCIKVSTWSMICFYVKDDNIVADACVLVVLCPGNTGCGPATEEFLEI